MSRTETAHCGPDQTTDFVKIWSTLYQFLAQNLPLMPLKGILLYVKEHKLNLYLVKNRCPWIKACTTIGSLKIAKNRQITSPNRRQIGTLNLILNATRTSILKIVMSTAKT